MLRDHMKTVTPGRFNELADKHGIGGRVRELTENYLVHGIGDKAINGMIAQWIELIAKEAKEG